MRRAIRVLLVHNLYQHPGGEDAVFQSEMALLRSRGHEVVEFVEDNARFNRANPLEAAVNTVWSRETWCRIRSLIQETKPAVAHFHNTFLRISPAAYYACKQAGVPVVQTLHNFRLLCPAATFFRDGRLCEDCLGKAVPWPGAVRGCWRGRAQTVVVATMLTVHRWLRTWTEQVDLYVALTEFARRKFIEGGLPADKIVVKPNFVHPDPGAKGPEPGKYVLFVGRLSPEKGVRTLLRAWRNLRGVPLKVVGDGPLAPEVRAFVEREGLDGVDLLGRGSREDVFALMRGARFLLFPSEWYEGFPMTIGEAFACGLPVVASHHGAMAEIVENGRTGLHFEPSDPEDLAARVEWAWTHPVRMAEMGREARREYEEKYTAEKNYEMLMNIYRLAMERAKGRAQ